MPNTLHFTQVPSGIAESDAADGEVAVIVRDDQGRRLLRVECAESEFGEDLADFLREWRARHCGGKETQLRLM